jgi:hypothetical protein
MASRAGSPNKNKQGLLARLRREFPGYHPVVEMARIANDLNNDVQLRGQMHSNVAKYVTPALKAIEVSGPDGENLTFNVTISPHAKDDEGQS